MARRSIPAHLFLVAAIAFLTVFSYTVRADAASSCTVVELYPGYPGYRGFITGLNGASDYDCLERLKERDPRFSKTKTDHENRQIAADLGITGSMKNWVWEDWLAIEARRGPMTTCYACALTADPRPPSPVKGDTKSNDPRLMSGLPGDNTLVRTWMRDRGLSTFYGDLPKDYQLRALVGMLNPGIYLTAPDIIDASEQFLDQWTKPGGAPPDAHILWSHVMDQGGYFPVPRTALPEDQVLGFEFAVLGLSLILTAERTNWLQSNLDQMVASWRDYLGRGGQHSLRVYAKSAGASNWM